MIVDEPPPGGSRLDGAIRLVIVETPDLAAPLVGALNAAEIGAWAWVEAEKCLYWSPPLVDILGIDVSPVHDLLSRFLRQIYPDDRSDVARLIKRQWSGDSFRLRFRFRSHGEERWLGIVGRIERDATGEMIRQGGILRDITAEVAQQQDRAEATARLEALINAMPFGVWGRSGEDLRVSHQNAASIAWWGDLQGRTVDEVPPEIARVWRQQISRALSGEVVKVRTTYARDDKIRIWTEIIAPVHVGAEATGVVGVSIDVTEEQRQRDFDALITDIATDLVSRSVDTLGSGVSHALERIGRFLRAGTATLCEVSADHQVRVTHRWIEDEGGGDRRAIAFDASPFADMISRLCANEVLLVRRLDEIPLPDAIQWLAQRGVLSFATVPVRHMEGVVVVIGLAGPRGREVDWPPDTIAMMRLAGTLLSAVVDRHRAEAKRQELERRMQDAQKLESLGVLAGGIAHDFNNLLTAILGNASVVRSELDVASPLEGPLEQIEVASKRAADLCRQMLAYAGRGRVAVQLFDINEVLRESESLMRVSVPKKARFELVLGSSLPPIVADLGQTRQVVMNLLINAAEALEEAEGAIRITTSERWCTTQELARTAFNPQLPEGPYLCLAVSDTGVGIPPETIERIFDPFFTTKFTGRGLGLAAVIGIVRAHKGALRVQSTVGQGSTFEVLMPIQSSTSPVRELPRVPDDETLAKWRTSGTVLVVDDEPGVRELVRAVLQRSGLTVLVAEDGRSAVEIFRARAAEISLVLLDLRMPGLDGEETLAAMREIRPEVESILMSGYSPSGMTAPITGSFVQKPFTPAALRAAVWKAWALR